MGDFFSFNLAEQIEKQKDKTGGRYVLLPFVYGGKFLSDAVDSAGEIENTASAKKNPVWGMSVLSAGSMRFRWNETNENRISFFKEISGRRLEKLSDCDNLAKTISVTKSIPLTKKLTPVPIELIHSKDVFVLETGSETNGLQGDGMITVNKDLLPVVTVADCVPIYLFDIETGCFGLVHSGWKGTGIIANAIELACNKFGAKRENICIAIGPHINECCYLIDEQRAAYFTENFGSDCIKRITSGDSVENAGKYALSLTRANLAVLKKCGIIDENIIICSDCTCCARLSSSGKQNISADSDDIYIYGSFRRQTAMLSSGTSLEEMQKHFTVQAAFCGYLF